MAHVKKNNIFNVLLTPSVQVFEDLPTFRYCVFTELPLPPPPLLPLFFPLKICNAFHCFNRFSQFLPFSPCFSPFSTVFTVLHWFYYPPMLRDSVYPVCGMLIMGWKFIGICCDIGVLFTVPV